MACLPNLSPWNVGCAKNSHNEVENARAAIQVYENISGASLNVAKLVFVPLVNTAAQSWFANIGCRVL